MASDDFRIVINGQEFKAEGSVLRPASESSFQQQVLKRLDGIEAEQKSIRAEVRTIHDEQLVLKTRVDMLIYGGGIAFTILCAVIAWTSLFAPKFWERSTKSESVQPDNQSVINSLSEAFLKGVSLGKNERG